MSEKSKIKQTTTLMLIALIAIAGIGYALYTQTTVFSVNNPKGTTPPSQLSTPTPAGTYIPNPTPTPTSTTPTPTSSYRIVTGSVWQALYVTTTEGQNYWIQPLNSYAIGANILGSPDAQTTDITTVQSMQNNIYMNINGLTADGLTVQTYTFTCQETITLNQAVKSSNGYAAGTVVATVVNAASIDITGSSIQDNANTRITGSTLTSSELQTYLNENGGLGLYGSGNYEFFTIVLSNIHLAITYTNGQSEQLVTTSTATSQNTLIWLIHMD